MSDFGFKEMQAIQMELQEQYIGKWGGLSPEKGREKLLWMILHWHSSICYNLISYQERKRDDY